MPSRNARRRRGLTGPVNMLCGPVRQKMPGAFQWAAGGQKFVQAALAAGAGLAFMPGLGRMAHFCLRPEDLKQDAASNAMNASVARVVARGAFSEISLQSPVGPLVMHVNGQARAPMSGKPRFWAGMELRAGRKWDPAAPWLLRDPAADAAAMADMAPAGMTVA